MVSLSDHPVRGGEFEERVTRLIAAALLEAGAVLDVHTAVALGMEDQVAAMLDADPSDTVYDGSPRDWADFQRKPEMVALLDQLTHPPPRDTAGRSVRPYIGRRTSIRPSRARGRQWWRCRRRRGPVSF